ncbi:MAG: bifunctional nuclease family protein [Armatimonadota bacterium]|nr:bifunctional nuclease family protein [Armatimonadota bacterium]MCX7778459.1 bifunctional nuclease family protein [Armatimonadota bacterium]MDW8026520.1 bifunctional nuclease family protein [Armatimonadota bacterium]
MFDFKQRIWRREFIRACSLAALFGTAVGMTLWRKFEPGLTSFLQRLRQGKTVRAEGGAVIEGTKQDTKTNVGGSGKAAVKAEQKEQETVPADYVLVEVDSIVTDRVGEPVVLLVDKSSRKYLPIWIGSSEAFAIAVALYRRKPPRPLTHDLLNTVIKALNGEVLRVVINKIEAQTYYASIILKGNGKIQEIDARPSDSIALALRVRSPIYLTPQVANLMEPMSESGQLKRT